MGEIAQRYADQLVVTNDNPRTEDPQSIVSEILRGIAPDVAVVIEHDRRRAIAYAISNARKGDVVLVAGKGHETYQQVGTIQIPFSDAAVVKEVMET